VNNDYIVADDVHVSVMPDVLLGRDGAAGRTGWVYGVHSRIPAIKTTAPLTIIWNLFLVINTKPKIIE
jgi:hypothetical protein